jgi:flagellar motor protein MotB
MRAQRPISREEEEEESVFVPMTDMVVSFLFIMMLLLAFFAVKYSTQDTVPRQDLVDAQVALDNARTQIKILDTVKDKLNAEIEQLQKRIDELLEQQRNLRTELVEVNTALDAARDQIKVLKIENKKLNDENERLELRNEELLTQLDAKDEEITKFKDDIVKRDARIKELEDELARLMKDRANPLELYVQSSREARQDILKQIEAQLRQEFQAVFTEQNILVEVKGDALRFKGQGLFADGSDKLTGDRLRVVRRLGDITLNAIQCYTVNSRQTEYASCNQNGVVVEAIQIEGHTDARGSNDENLGLSTRRANSAFFAMQTERGDILDFTNIVGQPVASVAGYGEMRPTASDTEENRGENRRIDLRIIMYTPGGVAEVLSIQEDIRKNLIGKP